MCVWRHSGMVRRTRPGIWMFILTSLRGACDKIAKQFCVGAPKQSIFELAARWIASARARNDAAETDCSLRIESECEGRPRSRRHVSRTSGPPAAPMRCPSRVRSGAIRWSALGGPGGSGRAWQIHASGYGSSRSRDGSEKGPKKGEGTRKVSLSVSLLALRFRVFLV